MAFECNQCEMKFLFQYELILHRFSHKIEIRESGITCELCNYKCIDEDHLQNHVNQHVAITKLKCGICSKEFIHERTFLTHKANHSKEYLCVLCDKKYKRNLSQHLQFHTRELPLKCYICNKLFARNDKLTAHVKTHNRLESANQKKRMQDTTKNFKCSQCEKQFSRKQHLDLHALYHNGGSTHVCEHCGQQFLRSDHLKRHVVLHKRNEMSQQCSCIVCDMWFSKDTLKQHMREHHSGKPYNLAYNCLTCGKSFQRKGHLIFHHRTHELKN